MAVAGTGILAGTDDGLFLSVGGGPWRRLPTVMADLDVHPRVTTSPLCPRACSWPPPLRASCARTTAARPGGSIVLALGPVAALAASSKQPGVILAASAVASSAAATAARRGPRSREPGADTHGMAVLPGTTGWCSPARAPACNRSTDQGQTWAAARAASPSPTSPGWPRTRREHHLRERLHLGRRLPQPGRRQHLGTAAHRWPGDRPRLDRGPRSPAPDRVLAESPAGGLQHAAAAPRRAHRRRAGHAARGRALPGSQ